MKTSIHQKQSHMIVIYTVLLFMLLLVTGCATVPDSPTSQIVLIASGHQNNTIDRTINPFNINCNNNGNKLNVNDILLKVKTEAIKQKTGLSSKQIEQAAKLLYSGQFRSDIRQIVVGAISIIPELAHTLPKSGVEIQKNIQDLKSKIHSENHLHKCIEDISSCSDKNALRTLFNDLYTDPTSELIRETQIALLDNQSFRLALIVYANSNGINIDSEDLDFVQNQLRKPNIDIAGLMDAGENRLKEKYKIEEVNKKLNDLKVGCN